MSYAQALTFVLAREGGRVDDPHDRGGRTAYGITQATYNGWRADQELAPADVWDITQEEVAAIYRARYWDAIHGDELTAIHPGIALCVFDCAVNSGPVRAVKQLQTALGADADGKLGPKTLGALEAADHERVLSKMLAARDTFFRSLVAYDPTQAKFLKGWLKRVNHLRAATGLDEVPLA